MKKIHKRLLSVLMVALILVISCVYPFINASAIVLSTGAALAISALSVLIGSAIAGIANHSAEEMTSILVRDISNAAELVSENWGTGVNSIATDFNNFVADFFDGYTIDGISVNGSDVASFVDYDSGTASIQYSEYERLRSQFAGSLYKPESDLVDDYLSISDYPVLFRGTTFTINVGEATSLMSKYSSRVTSQGYLNYVLLAQVNGYWCFVSFIPSRSFVTSCALNSSYPLCMNYSYPASSCLSATVSLTGNKLVTYGTSISGTVYNSQSYDCSFLRVGDLATVSGTPTDVIAVLLNGRSWTYDASSVNSQITGITSTSSISGTVETPSVDVENNDLQNIIENGQNVGVVDENPTLTFVPTDTASADVLIDDVPVAEVEKEIADEIAKTDFKPPDVDLWMEKFPFCLPYDFYRIITIFLSEEEPPVFAVPLKWSANIGGVNYSIDEELILDLTQFKLNGVDIVQAIIQGMILICFVVFLIKLTPYIMSPS